MSEQDILVDFLRALKEDLQMAVDDYSLFASNELLLMKDDVLKAWEDLDPDFDNALGALSHGKLAAEELRPYGLYGPQLMLKIGFWKKQREGARKLWAAMKRTKGRISSSLVHKLFDAANTILESLVSFSGFDPIKEFKDTIESIADASEGVRGPGAPRHFGVYLLAISGLLLTIVAGSVYGPAIFGASLNAPSMYYTLLALGLALLIGALAELRLESIESKIDNMNEISG